MTQGLSLIIVGDDHLMVLTARLFGPVKFTGIGGSSECRSLCRHPNRNKRYARHEGDRREKQITHRREPTSGQTLLVPKRSPVSPRSPENLRQLRTFSNSRSYRPRPVDLPGAKLLRHGAGS